ncbi:beta-ketoacyl synthase chain length factor [Mucilaginibacter jinjuensis]|uniref:Beta-ketoacyl synthase chain length factor n=1 Tax=Mucilaginibacter jinjuensis TaxID=1176721 RepID=A0ABY7T7H8_9SPHI|nr:beta-ketoacyl synthase chain length factor [Mucilaginibacter jinjuensis]WCT12193.1 beta-ketoacyl synthase chain length factor [Mucilaginibacter jinjuensis]
MMMKLYIRSASAISPQQTFGDVPFLAETIVYDTPRLAAIEPDYKPFLDPKLSRRMSRVIKMGVAAAKDSLQQANVTMPDAIITGTAYGCVEDTTIFLTRIIEQEEEMLPPTAFIQSTHNTVAAQIALMLQCHAYNNTFVHKSFSFESALMDAAMLFAENEASTILVGGIDEITDANYAIFGRFDTYKKGDFTNTDLFSVDSPGTIAGEGAAFFVLSNEASAGDIACLDAFQTFYKPVDIEKDVTSFLAANAVSLADIDLIISGKNGDVETDPPLDQLENSLFQNNQIAHYKHLCGEYPTASSFALWMAANVVKNGTLPDSPVVIKKVLICTHYQNKYWSLMLVSAC